MLDNFSSILKKISTTLFLYGDGITISKIQELAEINISEKDFLEILEDLKKNLKEIGLVLLISSEKDFLKKELSLNVDAEYMKIKENVKKEELEGDLSPASLQVLTICAYLGEVNKHDISFIRGVKSTQSIRSLSSRGLLKKDGEKYSLSLDSLSKLGLKSIQELPDYENIKKDFQDRLKDILEEEKIDKKIENKKDLISDLEKDIDDIENNQNLN